MDDETRKAFEDLKSSMNARFDKVDKSILGLRTEILDAIKRDVEILGTIRSPR